MRIAAVIIIYNPDHSIIKHINSFGDDVEKILIYDNSEQPNEYSLELMGLDKGLYFSDGINNGIAKRLNEAVRTAVAEGFDYLLCMDQDSFFPAGSFKKYLSYINAFKKKEHTVVWGTKFSDQLLASAPGKDLYEQSTFIITSGSLINLSLQKTIGAFDENLFIDLVDKEYCLRALENNLLCIRINEALLHHRLGRAIRRASIKSLYLVKKEKIIHSPLRCYYILRNAYYVNALYRHSPNPEVKKMAGIIVKNAKNYISRCIFYGDQPLQVMKYAVKAIADFKKRKMGKV